MPTGFFNNGSNTTGLLATDNVDFSGAANPSPSITLNGQLLIGSTSIPNIRTGKITSPNGTILIGYNSPNITVDIASGEIFQWSDSSGTFTAVSSNGYFITAASTSSLPPAPLEGSTVSYCVDTGSTLTIQASGAQKIRVGSSLSIAGGTCANTVQGDSITLVYRTLANTWFAVPAPQGIWNVQTS